MYIKIDIKFNKKIVKKGSKKMTFIFIILVSCFSGIISGMGMGGGTFLIPALSLIFGYPQIICQSTNIIVFIVIGIFCIISYAKSGLINFKIATIIAVPASIITIFFTLLSISISSKVLKILFAVFLICFGIYFFLRTIILLKKSNQKTEN